MLDYEILVSKFFENICILDFKTNFQKLEIMQKPFPTGFNGDRYSHKKVTIKIGNVVLHREESPPH